MSSTISVTIAQAEASNGSGLFVADTAANIVQGLATDHGLLMQVSSFTLSAAGTVTAGAAARLAALGAKFHLGGQPLTVQDSLANLALTGNAAGVALATGVQVVDAAFNLLSAASTRFAHVSSVVLTGSPILTAAQLTKLEALPHFSIAPGSAVTLSDTVSAISAVLSAHAGWFTPLTTISVHLDGSTIGAYTAGLLNGMMASGKHVSFVTSAGNTALKIGAALHDIAANAAPLNGLAAHVPLAFTVTNPAASVSATDAVNLLSLSAFGSHLAALNVADTAAAVDAQAGALFGHMLAGITVTAGAFSGTSAQLLSPMLHLAGTATAVLSMNAFVTAPMADSLAGLHGFSVASGVQLGIGDSYANLLAPANAAGYAIDTTVSVNDTAANLAAATAHHWGAIPVVYTLLGNDSATAAQVTALAGVGAGFHPGTYTLTLADTVANVLGIASQARGIANSIVITDVSANVTTAALNLLQSVQVPLTIQLTDTGHVRVSAATYAADTNVIDDIVYAKPTTIINTGNAPLPLAPLGAGAVTVTGSSADILTNPEALNEDWHVGNVAITDTAAALTGTVFEDLHDFLQVPLTITLSDPQTVLTVSAATYADDTAQVDAVQNAAALVVQGSAAGIAAAAAGLAADYRITAVQVTDTAAAFDSVAASLAPLAGKLAVTLTTTDTVGTATLALLALCSSVSLPGLLPLAGSVAGVTGLSARALGFAGTIAITDVSASLTRAALDTLQATVASTLASITLTDPGLVGVTAATYTADRGVLDTITAAGIVTVTGTTSAIDMLVAALKADTRVGSIVASDTAANVVGDIANLLNVGPKLSVMLTDTLPIAVGLVPQLALLPLSNAAHLIIADSGTNIAAVVEAATAATSNLLTAATVKLSGNSIVVAADAKALEGLSSFTNAGYTLTVWDTVAHLISGLYTATLANSDVSAVYLQTNGAPVTLSAANMLTMLALPHFHDTNPDGSPNAITISDTAAHLASAFATLQAHAAQLANVTYVVNASATVSEAMLAQLQMLGATAASGVALTVRDTAAAIAADLSAQAITLPSIAASAYSLSGSSTVSLQTAAQLGGQVNFTTGPYTLTVMLTANTPINTLGANELGNLGSSLIITGGGHLTVAGTVAQLSVLSHAALGIATPLVTDSFADIVSPLTGLTAASPLLGGTLTVNDAESISAAQAQSFFGLIKTGTGSLGVAAANVGFGAHLEAVTDSVAALEALTALPAWTQSTTLTPAFTLTASDTVANLIAAGNTSFLAGLAGTELSGQATTDAASAERLFALQTQIHYSAANSSLTVQDTAANLLNPNNADGLSLANSLTLAADDTTTAAGAETLLSNSKFGLTHVLTILDTPQNLLDATLGHLLTTGDYGSDVVVELSAPTTTDASTAAALVRLPGFADPAHDLTISDHPSFLIDPTYLAAETAATTVTIPGDETVSAATVLRLSAVPHFTPGANHLILGANDVADNATLAAIGDLGSSYVPNGHTITMTQDDTSLTQAEYTALQNDDVVTNGHLFSAAAPALTVIGLQDHAFGSEAVVTLSSTTGSPNESGYDASGNPIFLNPGSGSGGHDILIFADASQNFSFTQIINGTTSNPVLLLDTATLTAAAGGAAFQTVSTPGAIAFSLGAQEDYLPLYTVGSGSAPQPNDTALVYNPLSQTLSLQAMEHSTVLLTLGGALHPASLVAAEFTVKTFSS